MVSPFEYIIILLLGIIAYLLYQIVRQLTFLTGRKMRSPFKGLFGNKYKASKPERLPKEEKLPN